MLGKVVMGVREQLIFAMGRKPCYEEVLPTREYRSDEVFVSSSEDVVLQRVVVRVTDRVVGSRVVPVTLSFRRIQYGGDRGQRPGHQQHCVPIHQEPSLSVCCVKNVNNSY